LHSELATAWHGLTCAAHSSISEIKECGMLVQGHGKQALHVPRTSNLVTRDFLSEGLTGQQGLCE